MCDVRSEGDAFVVSWGKYLKWSYSSDVRKVTLNYGIVKTVAAVLSKWSQNCTVKVLFQKCFSFHRFVLEDC